MKKKFDEKLKDELMKEFKSQMDLDINEKELEKVLKKYRKIKRSNINEIRKLQKSFQNCWVNFPAIFLVCEDFIKLYHMLQ